jgi:membrane-bound ClpP family serine protease
VIWGLSRVLPRTPLLSRMVLAGGPAARASALAGAEQHGPSVQIGQTGQVSTPLRPFGKVVLDDDPARDHEARAEGPALDRGARVRVIEVQLSGRLVVAALESPARAEGSA